MGRTTLTYSQIEIGSTYAVDDGEHVVITNKARWPNGDVLIFYEMLTGSSAGFRFSSNKPGEFHSLEETARDEHELGQFDGRE